MINIIIDDENRGSQKNKKSESVYHVLESIATDICRNYCRFNRDDEDETDEEFDRGLAEHCYNCPLGRL